MAKAIVIKRQHNKTDLQNLSQRDRDFLTLETQKAMKKYNIGKQGVYDRKFALNKKIRAAGLSIEEVLNSNGSQVAESVNAATKKVAKKRGPKPTQTRPKPEEKQPEPITDIVKYVNPVPVIMKPIEINFENFSVKLNGVPKKISVNPETGCIEIDL